MGNFSKKISADNMKDILNRCICDFSVGFDSIAVDDILDIHRYSIRNYDIK